MELSGTKEFLNFLSKKSFLPVNDRIKVLIGKDLTEDYFIKNGFVQPIIVHEKDGLRLQVPESRFRIKDVEQYLGRDYVLDVIDVIEQDQFKMRLSEFVLIFDEEEPRSRRLNVLSLEISKTRMAPLVEPPFVIKEMSLIEKLWPMDDVNSTYTKPSVQKYCLMSMRDSWTDYHIDFGGSSVWYHVLWGRKIFYLIPPKKRYIKEYTSWMNDDNNRLLYFPDQLERYSENGISEVYKLEITSGQTILLPAGWIHAVHTVDDSLVFGGNFLHSLSIPLQLKIYKIEKFLKTEDRFLFPFFEKLHWFVAEYILHKLEGNIAHKVLPVKSILKGALKLIDVLPEWLHNYKELSHDRRQYVYPHRSYLSSSMLDLVSKLREVVHRIISSVPLADLEHARSLPPGPLLQPPSGMSGSADTSLADNSKRKMSSKSIYESEASSKKTKPQSL